MTNLFKTDSIALDPRAHMKEPRLNVEIEKGCSERNERNEKNKAVNVTAMNECVWDSYHDFNKQFVGLHITDNLPILPDTKTDTTKKTAFIAGREVKRQPIIDDFMDRIKEDDEDNHLRMERYPNPIGRFGGLHWFRATMLAAMIEAGKIGVKTVRDSTAVYMYRARTGNPFFRIHGGRTTLIFAVIQWYLAFGIFVGLGGVLDISEDALAFFAVAPFFAYNLIHWRFHKRYAYVLSSTIVDGLKARYLISGIDSLWASARLAIIAINLSFFTSLFIFFGGNYLKQVGFL